MICAWRLPGAKFTTVEAQSDSIASNWQKNPHTTMGSPTSSLRNSSGRFSRMPSCCPPKKNLISSPVQPAVFSHRRRRRKRASAETRLPLPNCAAPSRIYCTTAAKHLAPGGFFACVFPHEATQLARVAVGAKAAGLVIVRKRPVVFREGVPPLVGLFGMMRADDLPEWFRDQTWTEPELIIRTRDGKIHPEYSAVKLAIGFPP